MTGDNQDVSKNVGGAHGEDADDDDVDQVGGKGGSVYQVNLKLPPFWTDYPKVWFTRIESQFYLRGITKELTKFHHTIHALSPELTNTVISVVDDPDPASAYTDLKEALIERYAPHRPTQMMDFIMAPPISPGQDPFVVFDKIRALKLCDYEIESGHFLAKMPESIRHDLMKDADDLDGLKDLATAARRLMKKAGETVSQVSLRSREPEQRKKPSKGLCFSHRKYGDRAWECQKPCAWTGRRPTGRPAHLRALEDFSGNEEHRC